VPLERIERAVLIVRGQRVMLDHDLAALYGVSTRVLNQAVRRNASRFPPDFMFQLTPEEFAHLMSQFVTSKPGRGGHRKLPYTFTEQGVAMLSSVLKTERAVQVNIAIMRAFVRWREILASHTELARKLDELEQRHDAQFKIVFQALRQLTAQPEDERRRRIGFEVHEAPGRYEPLTTAASTEATGEAKG